MIVVSYAVISQPASFWFVKSLVNHAVYFQCEFDLCAYSSLCFTFVILPLMCIVWHYWKEAVTQDGTVFMGVNLHITGFSVPDRSHSFPQSEFLANLVPLICFSLRCGKKQPSTSLCRQLLLW